jgi:hypothetical protein
LPGSGTDPRKIKLILAFDVGTTRTELATAAVTPSGERYPPSDAERKKPEPEIFKEHADYTRSGNTWQSTALYFSDLTQLPITGHRLKALLENNDPEVLKVERLFANWKTLFQDDAPIDKLSRLRDLGMEPKDLLRIWVQIQYQQLISTDPKHIPKLGRFRDLSNFEIEVVAAVPPGRAASAHTQVREAFIQAPIGAHQVSLVSEPECLFRSWVSDNINSDDIKVHDEFWKMEYGKMLTTSFR